MARHASAVLVAALLVATAAAFAYTEHLKLTPSPILGTRVDKVFSPVCDCETDTASISFRLREPETLAVDVVRGGRVVRRLAESQSAPAGRVTFVWDGRDDAGEIVPEGRYRPRVRLETERRRIRLPNPIVVDTTPPVARLLGVRPLVFSPDADRRRDRVHVRYRLSEDANAILYVDGERHTVKRGKRQEGTLQWDGRANGATLGTGGHRLTVAARDVAGNLGGQSTPRSVTLRYVTLARERIVVRAGGRFRVRVSTDSARVEWRLGRRQGTAPGGLLRLRAPLLPGRYTLTVEVGSHADRAAVVVRRTRARLGRAE